MCVPEDDERLALVQLAIFISVVGPETERHRLFLGRASEGRRDAPNLLALPQAEVREETAPRYGVDLEARVEINPLHTRERVAAVAQLANGRFELLEGRLNLVGLSHTGEVAVPIVQAESILPVAILA